MTTGAGAPQTETKNTLTIDFAGNKELQSIFSRKDSGDTCELTLELQVINKTPDYVTLAIKKVTAEEYDNNGEERDIVPDNAQPIMMVMKNKKYPKGEGKPAYPSTQSTAQPTQNSQGFTSYA